MAKLTKRQKVGAGALITGIITAIVAAVTRKPPIPTECTPGEPDRCFDGDLYRCSLEGRWKLLEKNSPLCVAPTRLHGRVRDKANHNLLSGVLVELVDTGLFDTTVTGMYHIDDTPFGTQTLKFTHPDYKLLVKTVDLVPGINNKIEDVFLETIAVIGSIRGRLKELDVATGFTTPIPNIAVNIDGYTAICDSAGYFYFANMPFAHYSTLTAEGYKPLLIDLDVIGDMDLGVVEMVRVEAEYIIHLDKLEISPPSIVVGVAVEISCQAGLSIAPVGEAVTRTVSLFINGALVETRDITLVRTNKYWPATTTVRFVYTPASAGTYSVEIDGLIGSFEAIGYVNYATPVGPELAWDVHEIVPRIPERCIPDSFPLSALNRDINIVSVNDIGFDGKTVWYTIEVAHNETGGIWDDPHGFKIYLDIIAESEYTKLINIINAGRYVTKDKCRELWKYKFNPLFPPVDENKHWDYIAMSQWIDHAEAGHPWHEEESNIITHSETIEKTTYPKRPPLPAGKYKILLAAYYRRTWPYSVDKFKGWLIGEIIFP